MFSVFFFLLTLYCCFTFDVATSLSKCSKYVCLCACRLKSACVRIFTKHTYAHTSEWKVRKKTRQQQRKNQQKEKEEQIQITLNTMQKKWFLLVSLMCVYYALLPAIFLLLLLRRRRIVLRHRCRLYSFLSCFFSHILMLHELCCAVLVSVHRNSFSLMP